MRLSYPNWPPPGLGWHPHEAPRDHDAFIVTRIVVDPSEFQLVHALAAAEWYVFVPGNAREERFDDARRFGRSAYRRQLARIT